MKDEWGNVRHALCPLDEQLARCILLTTARTKRPHNGKYVTASFQSSCELHAITM